MTNTMTLDQMITLNPTMKYAGETAILIAQYIENNTPDNRRDAMRSYAQVDWIETEVDPEMNPISNAFLNMVYEMGKAQGFKIMDELTELEMELLDIR